MKLLILAAAFAVEQPLPDPLAEARAQHLFMEIRCVVCAGQPIGQSETDIAADMRGLIRDQIRIGRSDTEIRRFFAQRYGDEVLLRPPAKGLGGLLYLAPVLGIAGLIAAFLHMTARHKSRDAQSQ